MTAETSNARWDAESKTVPVPTRVHLIGETAVIVGTPGRGWDEDAQDAHNCDDMGCSTIGPHVLARVPFTDERANVAHATAPLQDEIEALRAEVERANSWNERVSVCRDHVADIVDGPCVICALDAAEDRADKLTEGKE